jgi:translation elongation factor EF-1alpha
MASVIEIKKSSESPKFVPVSADVLDELNKKAEKADFYKGKVLGMEWVIEALVEAFKSKESE